jgi:hypothetical protein
VANAKVDIVKVKNPSTWEPGLHHAVEQEVTEKLLFECGTQAEAILWAKKNGHEVNIHRERNRKPTDKHGRFRTQ